MTEVPAAGWYPQRDGRLRYWDGTGWTETYYSQPPPQQPRPDLTPFSQAVGDAVRRLLSWFAGLSSKARIALGTVAALVLVTGIDLSALHTPEASYLLILRRDSWFANRPDSNLLKAGHNVCAELDNGGSRDALFGAAERLDMPSHEQGEVIGAAVEAFCANYLPKAKAWLAGNPNW